MHSMNIREKGALLFDKSGFRVPKLYRIWNIVFSIDDNQWWSIESTMRRVNSINHRDPSYDNKKIWSVLNRYGTRNPFLSKCLIFPICPYCAMHWMVHSGTLFFSLHSGSAIMQVIFPRSPRHGLHWTIPEPLKVTGLWSPSMFLAALNPWFSFKIAGYISVVVVEMVEVVVIQCV